MTSEIKPKRKRVNSKFQVNLTRFPLPQLKGVWTPVSISFSSEILGVGWGVQKRTLGS